MAGADDTEINGQKARADGQSGEPGLQTPEGGEGNVGQTGELLSREPDSMLGTRFANSYDILSVIGEGGMGVVYKARHVLMNRMVAVKVLHPHLAQDRSLKRFRQEAEAASKLSHPNVIAVYDFGVAPPGLPYLVMDYLPGESLADAIKAQGRIPVERALNIFIQACDGLAHAHNMGIVHRDLKPSNIMLVQTQSDWDVVKIVDFGIAKILPQEGEDLQKLTQTGELFGSPAYMSPEQCMGQALDFRSDIYSFGCMFYEALVGVQPFRGTHVYETFHKLLNEMPPSLVIPGCNRALLERLDAVVFKAMEKSRDKRYPSMAALKQELESIQRDLSGGRKVWASISGLATRLVRHARRIVAAHPKVAVALLVLLVSIPPALMMPTVYGALTKYVPSDREMAFVQEPRPVVPKSDDFYSRESALQQILKMRRGSDDPGHRWELKALNGLAKFYEKFGEFRKARTCYLRIFEIVKEQSGEESLPMADVYESTANCVLEQGLIPTAEFLYGKVVTIRLKAGAGGEPSPQLARPFMRLGDILYAQGKFALAASRYEQALRILRDTGDVPGGQVVMSSDIAVPLGRLADTYLWQGDLPKAEERYKMAANYWDKVQKGPQRQNYGICLSRLAESLYRQNKIDAADSTYKQALNEMEKAMGAEHPFVARVLQDYSNVLWTKKNWPEALSCRLHAAMILARS